MPHIKLPLICRNKDFSMDISFSQCIYDTIFFIIDGIKCTSTTTIGRTAASFNLSLIDEITPKFNAFNAISIIIWAITTNDNDSGVGWNNNIFE